MNYFDTLKNRSVFLRHILFASRQRGAADLPVDIDRAPLPQGAAAQEKARTQENAAAQEKVWEAENAPARENRAAQQDAALLKNEAQKDGGTADWDMPPTGEGAFAQHAPADTDPAAAQTQLPRGSDAQVLQGVDAAAQLIQGMRDTALRYEAATQEAPWQKTPDAANTAAALLWTQLRSAESSAALAVQQRTAPVEYGTTPARGRSTEAADWSACFEQDARRYDGTHPLY